MSLSTEEFERFQNQLVELKTNNYQLDSQNKKLAAGNKRKFCLLFFLFDFLFFHRKYSIKNSNRNP